MFKLTLEEINEYTPARGQSAFLPVGTIKCIDILKDETVNWGGKQVPQILIEVPGQGQRKIAAPHLFTAAINGPAVVHNPGTEIECLDYDYIRLSNWLKEKAEAAEADGKEFQFPSEITITGQIAQGGSKEFALEKKEDYVTLGLVPEGETFDETFKDVKYLPRVYLNSKTGKPFTAKAYAIEPLDD